MDKLVRMRPSKIIIALALLAAPAWAGASLRYAVELSADAAELRVALCTDRAVASLSLSRGGRGAGHLIAVRGDGDSSPRRRGDRIEAGRLAAGQCLRYTVDARGAGRGDRYQPGWSAGTYLMLPVSAWLWRPRIMPEGAELELSLPAGWSASLPWPAIAGPDRRYRLPHTPLSWDGTSAFGRFEERRVALPGGQLRVSVLPLANARQTEALHDWVLANARAVLTSSGRLPLADVQVLVVPLPGVASPTPWGQVTRGGGSALKLFAGLDAAEPVRAADWTLSHELSHLFHPYLGGRGRWLGEGLASYFQNVLRARSGALTAEQAWRKLDAGFGRGRDERRSRGQPLIDVSASYRGTMRVYWSGAAYWLEADLALRERHGGSLDAVLAAFARRHLPAAERWEPDRFVAELDALAGAEVFVPLYRRYARGTRFPELDDTYRRLGLGSGIDNLRLRRDAPAVAIRHAIMSPSPRYAKASPSGPGG